jgi:hypothetical protein
LRTDDERDARSDEPAIEPGTVTRLLAELVHPEEQPAEEPADENVPAATGGLQAGDRLGKFLLVREIGRGGFGVVFEAEDTVLRRRVAVKVLRAERSGKPVLPEWIEREGEAAARVRHRNVVTLHDVGRWEGGTYLVYELLEGETLGERLQRGRIPRAEARRILRAVAEGLAHMHAAGVVHRDVKPDNVFIETDGNVKVLDLGLAQVAGAVGIRAGSYPYAAPEQWDGNSAHAQVDVYAWGILAERLLTRRPVSRLAEGHSSLLGILPALAARAHAREPAERPRDGVALVAELDRADRRRRGAAAMAVAAGILAVLAGGYVAGRALKRSPGVPSGPFRVAVADAENGSGRPALDGLGDLVARGLEQNPRLQVLDRARLSGVLRASGRPAPERLDRGVARFATRQAGAAALLVPAAAEDGGVFVVSVEAFWPETGDRIFRVEERADSEGAATAAVARLTRRAADTLLARETEVRGADREIDRAVSSSLTAHERYLEGVRCIEHPSEAGEANLQRCERHFQEALAIDPDFALARFELVHLGYWMTTEPGELRDRLAPVLRQANRLPPREQALARAWSEELEGRPDAARQIFLSAASQMPDDPRLALAVGYFLFRQGQMAEAAPHLERAVTIDPGAEFAWDLLLATLRYQDRTADLLRVADRLGALRPTAATLLSEAIARASAGDLDGALRVVRHATPNGMGAGRDLLEDILVARGDWAEAEAMLREDVAREPDRRPDRLVRFLLLRGRVREARALVKSSPPPRDARPSTDVALRETNQFLAPAGDVDGIRKLAREARERTPEGARSFAIALAYVGAGDDAASLLEAWNGDAGSVALVEALIRWRKEGARAALPTLRRAARDDPTHAWIVGPDAPTWFAAEAAVEASPDASALDDLRRARRCFYPLGQWKTWTQPRGLLLEARVLAGLGRSREAHDLLARLEAQLAGADPDYPLLAEMRALRRRLGGANGRLTQAPAGGSR